ncbi:hypothetical protein DXT90_11640 [Agrobacterium tumefaciens]|nr:hypothetical protein [Agrobacterium tumefaciens]
MIDDKSRFALRAGFWFSTRPRAEGGHNHPQIIEKMDPRVKPEDDAVEGLEPANKVGETGTPTRGHYITERLLLVLP